ncbi:MAG: glycosyltransferase family 2 protein [Bacteroidota bacterium]|nr:glycosyltransferase family 2 protein [Bacteroidota bacterium]
MKISVITPAFNSANVIRKNVLSIISQNYSNFEHIIIDKRSSDSTLQIVTDLYRGAGLENKLKIFSGEDTGISDAFNKGINAASGNIITILNSDDSYIGDAVFDTVVNLFRRNPKSLIVHGDIFFKDEKYGSNVRNPLPYHAIEGVLFNHPTMFLKREVYTEIGLFDTDFKYSMDFELYCRLAKKYKPLKNYCCYYQNEPLVLMEAGGASWKNEFGSIAELKKALIKNGLWGFDSSKFYYARLFRTKVKEFLTSIKMDKIITKWRNLKWKK